MLGSPPPGKPPTPKQSPPLPKINVIIEKDAPEKKPSEKKPSQLEEIIEEEPA